MGSLLFVVSRYLTCFCAKGADLDFTSPLRCCREPSCKSEVKAPWMAHLASSRHGCRVGATSLLQLGSRLARRAASLGCISLVTFFVQAKKVTRPYQTCLVRSRTVETGETMPPSLSGWWVISPVLTRVLHSKCAWQRASYFSCSCKKSNQKNTPPRGRPTGKP